MDVMLDIETFGNTSTAAIVQVAAVLFDRNTGKEIDSFKAEVDPVSSVDAGMTMDAQTVMWWLQQSKPAQKSITKQPRGSIREVLTNFNTFISRHEPNPRNVIVWCHATFDFPIMENAYKLLNINSPWHYRSARDLRTLVDLGGVDVYNDYANNGTAHDALDDCRFQVKYTYDCLKKTQGVVA